MQSGIEAPDLMGTKVRRPTLKDELKLVVLGSGGVGKSALVHT